MSFAGYGFFGDVVKDSEKLRWVGVKRYDISGAKVFLANRYCLHCTFRMSYTVIYLVYVYRYLNYSCPAIPYHTIYHAIPYHTIYHTMPYHTKYHTMPYHTIYHTMPYHIIYHKIHIPYHAIPYQFVILYHTNLPYHIMQYYTIPYILPYTIPIKSYHTIPICHTIPYIIPCTIPIKSYHTNTIPYHTIPICTKLYKYYSIVYVVNH